jgi:hypothetical protein
MALIKITNVIHTLLGTIHVIGVFIRITLNKQLPRNADTHPAAESDNAPNIQIYQQVNKIQ